MIPQNSTRLLHIDRRIIGTLLGSVTLRPIRLISHRIHLDAGIVVVFCKSNDMLANHLRLVS